MKISQSKKSILAALLCIMLTISMIPAVSFAGDEDGSASDGEADGGFTVEGLEEGTYEPGEVIVSFRDGAVKDRDTSLKAARSLENVDTDFGESMEATGEAGDAADDAKSEVKILKASLGDDFVIKDSIAFDEDLTVCLVSSEKYDTETLIEKLSGNPDVRSVEPNYYTEDKNYDYSLDDVLSQYAYQTNSPLDKNAVGKDVSGRGTKPEGTLSQRAGAVTPDFPIDHTGEDEIVVAVVDSGINYDHEDLKNMLWTNPGNIDLLGEHGFNFEDNAPDVKDTFGHGTHCAGIIGAQANNAKGVAGVASGVNVKIMMLANTTSKTDIDPENAPSSIYSKLGSLNYVLRAKERGVNVVATSNSWGSPGDSYVFDDIFNRLGEAGVLNFVAASNDAVDIDRYHYYPPAGDSPYMVVVGSANVTGNPSGFTDYGKANVDLFATGSNILSTYAFSSYFPSLYSAEERAENTEYYGQFSTKTEVGEEIDPELGTNRVVPDTAGEGVKAFGAAKFWKQPKNYSEQFEEDDYDEEDSGEGDPGEVTEGDGDPGEGPDEGGDPGEEIPEAVCKVSVTDEKYFTDNYEAGSEAGPASLKVTIENARNGEEYYLYFPYEKNHETTGLDNTRYSVTMITQHLEGEHEASISAGEVVRYEKDGTPYMKHLDIREYDSDPKQYEEIVHCTENEDMEGQRKLLSWEDADPDKTNVKETGIGIAITPTTDTQEESSGDKEDEDVPGDITVYIDAVGLSKPVTEDGKAPEDVFKAESSYELMSGTSMATPVAAGAYAVLASLYPQKAGQSGAEYAKENRARLFSIVRQTSILEDLCSTGGFIDLSLLKEESKRPAVSDAVCDVKKGTITLHGINLTDDLKLSCRSLADSSAPERILADEGMKAAFSNDGRTVTISGAKSLFGTYTEFLLKNNSGDICARGSFFLVKGQTKMKKVLNEEHKDTYADGGDLMPRCIFTDSKGESLYAYQMNSSTLFTDSAGVLYKYDGAKFVEYKGTGTSDAVFDYYEELGFDRHQITRGLTVTPRIVKQPLYENDTLYDLVDVEYRNCDPSDDEWEEDMSEGEGDPDGEGEPAPDDSVTVKHYLASMKYTEKRPQWTFKEIQSLDDEFAALGKVSQDDLAYCVMNGKIYCFGSIDPDDELNKGLDKELTFVFSCDPETGVWERGEDLKDTAIRKAYTYLYKGKAYLMFGYGSDSKPLDSIYVFDSRSWEKKAGVPFIGKAGSKDAAEHAAVAPVKDGLMFVNYSIEGAGNVSLYRPDKEKYDPMYYTITDGFSDPEMYTGSQSAVETKDGIYYITYTDDIGQIKRLELHLLPKSSRVYRTSYKDANPIKVTAKNQTVKYNKVKKANVTRKAVTVKKAAGKVTYKRAKISCKKDLLKGVKRKIKVNTKTGKITFNKGLKKGTYTVTVKVTAKGDDLYKSATKSVKIKVKVK